MKKIYKKEQLKKLNHYPNEVNIKMKEIIDILDNNYDEDRDFEKDLGGYILVVEDKEEINIIKKDILKGIVAEYIDIIECEEEVNWTSSLFLLSSDYAIVVFVKQELTKFLLNE